MYYLLSILNIPRSVQCAQLVADLAQPERAKLGDESRRPHRPPYPGDLEHSGGCRGGRQNSHFCTACSSDSADGALARPPRLCNFPARLAAHPGQKVTALVSPRVREKVLPGALREGRQCGPGSRAPPWGWGPPDQAGRCWGGTPTSLNPLVSSVKGRFRVRCPFKAVCFSDNHVTILFAHYLMQK